MTKLEKQVADLLSTEAATAPDFFGNIIDRMISNGYIIEAHQRGIQGTYLCIRKLVVTKSDEPSTIPNRG